MTDVLRIARRFNGPPTSGNGGYVCGRLGRLVDGPAAVRLHVPPPLDADLAVERDGDRLRLVAGDTLVAEARPEAIDVTPPAPPTAAAAAEASTAFRGIGEHWFPRCFVCGPAREPGDGLRIFPGPVAGQALVAAPWAPDASLAGADGVVAPEFVWSALDCPGAFSFPPPEGRAVLLGELAVACHGTVTVDEACVVVGWEIEHRGRKHLAGTALYGADGACVAVGRAVWIEVPVASPAS